jgi:UDP-N-acetylmuramoylalanine--D-glutamate ligase
MDVQNKRVLVVGLARSGLSVARALVRRGAVVTVSDRKQPGEFADILPELLKDKVGLELGAQRVETFLKNEIIIISPGIPWDLPQLQAARDKNIPVYPEVEAASWFLDGTIVGVTGSNGKTTTTSLLGDMLKASGFPTFVGGNIGNALSSAVDQAQPGTKFVTELSSFQLEGIHNFRPHVAVMLNLSPNHLDRHPSFEAYGQAKRQIFRNQGQQDYAVLNADDPWVAGLRSTMQSRPVFFSRQREIPTGVFLSGGKIYYRVRHLERVLFEKRDVRLLGDFNLEDVLAATTAACLLGADFAAIRKAVREFKAVEHRLEFVMEIQGVDFYNNSKATSVDATLKSLDAFEHGVHLIMGGKDKGAPYTPLLPLIKDRVREVLLIGAAAPIIAKQLTGATELVEAGDLATAVYQAFARSRPGDTVLLAPACSSFDQFKDYEERGMVFKELVKMLQKDVAEGSVARAPASEVRSPWAEVRSREAGGRGPKPEARGQEAGSRSPRPETRIPGFEIRTPRAASPGPEVSRLAPIVRVTEREPKTPEPKASSPAPVGRGIESGARADIESGVLTVESKALNATPPAPAKLEAAVPQCRESGVHVGLESGILNLESNGSRATSPKPQSPIPPATATEPPQKAALGQMETPPVAAIQVRPLAAKPDPAPMVFATGSEPARPVAGLPPEQTAKVAEPPEIAPSVADIPPIQEAAARRPDTVNLNPSAPLRVSFADDPRNLQSPQNEPDSGGSSPEMPAQNISTANHPANHQLGDTQATMGMEPPNSDSVASTAESRGANPEPRVTSPVSGIPSPELRVPSPVSHLPSPLSRGPLELSYVYEVDAIETPEVESQVVPEDEPSISISVGKIEAIEDQVLPFESRPEVKAAVTNSAGPRPAPRGKKKRRGHKDSARGPSEGQPPLTGAE